MKTVDITLYNPNYGGAEYSMTATIVAQATNDRRIENVTDVRREDQFLVVDTTKGSHHFRIDTVVAYNVLVA